MYTIKSYFCVVAHADQCVLQHKNYLTMIDFYSCIPTSVGPEPNIPKQPQFLHFGTKDFEQFRFQSIQVPIPKLKVPPDLDPNYMQHQIEKNANNPLKALYLNPGIKKQEPEPMYQNQQRGTETRTELKYQYRPNTNSNIKLRVTNTYGSSTFVRNRRCPTNALIVMMTMCITS